MSDPAHLLPPSASTTERAIETVMAERTVGIEAPITHLWNVDTCPVELLPWLAWSFSVEVWDHDWPEDIKRNVIRNAVQVHRTKGTRQSVALALEALGFRVDIVEGWEDGGAPHTFRLDAFGDEIIGSGFALDQTLVETVEKLIRNVKPVRSHFALRVGQSFEYPNVMRFGVTANQVLAGEVRPSIPRRASTASVFCRSAVRAAAKRLIVQKPSAPSRESRDRLSVRSAICARQVVRLSFLATAKPEAPNAA